jgi:hypothetical protein
MESTQGARTRTTARLLVVAAAITALVLGAMVAPAGAVKKIKACTIVPPSPAPTSTSSSPPTSRAA